MAPTHASLEANQHAKTILVIEDDDGIGEFMVNAIQQETPYQVIRFTYGYEAWTFMQQDQRLLPNLFILDYNLPLMTGIELYDHIHAQKEFAHIPVLIMSAYDRQCRALVKARNLTFLQKPFALDDLLDSIERLIV